MISEALSVEDALHLEREHPGQKDASDVDGELGKRSPHGVVVA